jgi:signal transduction histidine kinase
MYRLKLLFCFALLVFPTLLPAGQPVLINQVVDFNEINTGVQYYVTPAKKIPGIVVAQPGAAILKVSFQPVPETSPVTRSNFFNDFYFRFTVSNTSAIRDSVLFYPGVLVASEIYRVDTTNGALFALPDSFSYTTQVSNQGIHLPFIKLNPGETQTLLVHAHFRYFNYMEWRPTLVRKDQLLLLTYSYKVKPELNFLFISLFFLGILSTMFVYAMIKTYQTRLKEFFFYGFSVLFFIFYFGYQLTLLFNFSNWYQGLDLFMKQFFQIGAHIFYMLFATYFLDIRKNLPVLYRIMKVIYVILAVYLAIVFFTAFNDKYFQLNMQLFNAIRIMLLLYSVYAIPVLFRCKVPLANYVAHGATAVSIFAAFAFYYSNVPEGYGSFFMAIGGPITLFKLGLLIEQVFFTMGLAKKSQVEEGYRIKAVEMLRIDNEKKEFEKFMAVMETKEKERTRIAQEIHDDIGSGLTTIRLLSEIARSKESNGHSGEMEKISASANELIENMNEIIWSFNARNDTLPNLVAYIRRYVVGYFEPTDINVKIIIPVEIPPVQISGDFRRSVFLVIKESIHNIMKHAKATEIMLQVEVSGEFSIRIKDNGSGFNNEAVKLFSNGLRSMRERMEHIGGRFEISGNNGTEVTLSLPV